MLYEVINANKDITTTGIGTSSQLVSVMCMYQRLPYLFEYNAQHFVPKTPTKKAWCALYSNNYGNLNSLNIF